ncbi:glycosyltransferase family 4 protein [Leuconostoc mesenteroides]|uniref:glycosyltransferase family 4 protein n=1 Tax=Leuconostoc mesenteroides TaxID=1245 RepID=UPI0007510A3C|nr:glycosyltransferase family 4 protein [Leuconostoc mesenteroides]MBZ1519355.1 glycosyltransferase family 4 protein [Leuconostoc mesenteroides]MBZ1521625.1 glycosyltransferase family 4 protein [Leuconostoc mesenteroides]MBZ1523925.1 glycosyltransferase family 4 protein [Leuconostoc mesenteroides]WMS39190.1 glycosyltransferase family 4 protein [Leuconostoc mesenteroides]
MVKKILLISNLYPSKEYPEYGTFVKEFVTGLTDLGWDITKIVLIKKNDKFRKLLSYASFLFKSWVYLNFSNNDITYIHYASHSTIPLLFSKKQKFLVVNVHGSDVLPNNERQKYFSYFTKNAVQKANMIVVPSKYFKKVVLKKYNVPSEKIFISASGGVDETFFQKRSFKYQKHTMTIGFVGRIESVKGWQTFLESLQKITIDDTKFLIFGSGSQEKELKQKIKITDNPNIKYMGHVGHNELGKVYQSFDWLILPSKRESLGLVGIEAMAMGTPIIASDIDGIKTYAVHKKNSLLFNPGDSKQLADYISLAKQMDYSEWESYSNQAVRTATNYEKSTVMRQLNEKLLECIR